MDFGAGASICKRVLGTRVVNPKLMTHINRIVRNILRTMHLSSSESLIATQLICQPHVECDDPVAFACCDLQPALCWLQTRQAHEMQSKLRPEVSSNMPTRNRDR